MSGKNRMRFVWIATTALLVVVGVLAITSCASPSNPGSTPGGPQESLPQPSPTVAASLKPTTETPETLDNDMENLILEIPIASTSAADPSAEPIITGYEQKIIRPGDEFILDPFTLGPKTGEAVGALKLKLVEAQDGQVTVSVLADQRMNGKFYPRDPLETVNLSSNSCIPGYPLVMDVFYRYCFDILEDDNGVVLRYRIEEESTLPSP